MTKVKRTHQERKTDEDACEVKEIDGDWTREVGKLIEMSENEKK
jgi:hypothetical protein